MSDYQVLISSLKLNFLRQLVLAEKKSKVSDGNFQFSLAEVQKKNLAPEKETPADILEMIKEVAQSHNLDPQLMASVAAVESGFNSQATSPAGAMGLMQLMPATARSLGVTNPYDPLENLAGGARYLRYLLDRYQGDEVRALAAYNAGPGRVDASGGVPPIPETRAYVEKVLRLRSKNKVS